MKLNALILAFMLIVTSVEAKTLKINLGSPPVTFDWTGKTSMLDAPVILNIHEGLFRYQQPQGKLIGALAESVTVSKDLRQYTFKIRKGAKWSDGRPVFAQDFAYGWLRLLAPQTPSLYTYYLFGIKGAKEFHNGKLFDESQVGIKAVDDATLLVTLDKPQRDWHYVTAFWPLFPVRKDQVEKLGSNWSKAGVLITAGPYVLDSYDQGKKITLVKNQYYKSTSNVDQVDITFNKDFDPQIADYKSKKIDVLMELPYNKLSSVQGRDDFYKRQIARLVFFGFNGNRYPFNDAKIRESFLKILDQSKLAPKGFAPASSMLTKQMKGSSENLLHKNALKEGLDQIKKSGLIITPKLNMEILTISREPYWSVGKQIQEQLTKALGLNVELTALDSVELNAQINLGDFSAMINSWTSKINSPFDILSAYTSDASLNPLRFSNEKYDLLLHQAMAESNPKKQEKLLIETQKVMMRELAVYLPLFFDYNYYLVQKQVKGFYLDHMGNFDLHSVSLL